MQKDRLSRRGRKGKNVKYGNNDTITIVDGPTSRMTLLLFAVEINSPNHEPRQRQTLQPHPLQPRLLVRNLSLRDALGAGLLPSTTLSEFSKSLNKRLKSRRTRRGKKRERNAM